VVVLALAAAVAAHHAGPVTNHHGMHGAPAEVMLCLAVLGSAVLVAVGASVALRRAAWRAPRMLAPRVLAVPSPPRGLPARASPVRLQVLRL
jgi:hypothetical protein